MKEIYGDFEDLVLVNLHHHNNVVKAHLANANSFFISSHCPFQPLKLIFEKLRVEVGDSPSEDFKDIAIPLLN